MRNVIIGLSVLFFILASIITIKALSITVKNVDDRRYSQGTKSEVDGGEGLPEQEDNHIDKTNKSSGTIMADDRKASHRIYTIQLASFMKIERAHKQFDIIVKRLNEKKLDYLRIEKRGKYYSVKLGKFIDHTAAERFLQAIKPRLTGSLILKSDINDDKIMRLYEVGERPVL